MMIVWVLLGSVGYLLLGCAVGRHLKAASYAVDERR